MKANQGKHRYDRSGRDLSLAPIYSMLMSRWCFKIYKWDEKVKTILILNLNKKNLSSLCKTSIQIINPLSHNLKDLTSNTNLYRCRLRKRCPNKNIHEWKWQVPWGLQININVVSYCLTLHENKFCSFNIIHRYAWSIWYLILHMKKKYILNLNTCVTQYTPPEHIY